MDNEQAKLILSTFRPGGEDACDPFFAEALAQVRHDPELGAWFAEQRRFDQFMHSALHATTPPVGLREKLLVNQNIVRLNQPSHRWKTWSNRPWWAIAASMLLLLTLGFLLLPSRTTPMTTERLVQEAFHLEQSDGITHGKTGGGNDALRAWLASQGSPADFILPNGLKGIEGMGCQTFSIDGQKVSLICFMVDEDKDLVVHFFVTDSRELAHPPGSTPTFIHHEGLTAATWSSGKNTYILLGRGVDEETLSRLI